MVKAFVFGKFLPFHEGHAAMIRFALGHCDFLSVLVCCSDQETIPCDVRVEWIRETFADDPRLEVLAYNYLESELPNTSESSQSVSEVWSAVFKQLFPDYSLLVTAEPYGEMVAAFMGIRHLFSDVERERRVSATTIRNDIFRYWNYLPAAVKPYFSIKVALLGTESTGKTTLTQQLAQHYRCSYVLEAARDIIADSNSFTLAHLREVARAHAARIACAMRGDSALVIVDTDIHTTMSYCSFVFGEELEVGAEDYAVNGADLYLYLCKDVPYAQDGTRLGEAERDLLDASHRQVLVDCGIDFVEIRGGWEERFWRAVVEIDALLERRRFVMVRI